MDTLDTVVEDCGDVSSSSQSDTRAWDQAYTQRGRLWAGPPSQLPELKSGSRVLEVGSGNGKSLPTMIARGWRVVAMDISRRALDLCPSDKCHLVQADGQFMPFFTGVFDLVVLNHVLGHLPQQGRRAMAEEAARVARRGATVHLRDFGRQDMRFGRGREVEEGSYIRGGVLTHYFRSEEVEELFPCLEAVRLQMDRWSLRLRGRDNMREELVAHMVKP